MNEKTLKFKKSYGFASTRRPGEKGKSISFLDAKTNQTTATAPTAATPFDPKQTPNRGFIPYRTKYTLPSKQVKEFTNDTDACGSAENFLIGSKQTAIMSGIQSRDSCTAAVRQNTSVQLPKAQHMIPKRKADRSYLFTESSFHS